MRWRNVLRREAKTLSSAAVSSAMAVALLTAGTGLAWVATSSEAGAATQLDGAGSSFEAQPIEMDTAAVQLPPYDLAVSYTGTSSGDGRYEFTNQTTNFGATDIQYGLGPVDTNPPSFPFVYVPFTGAGIAFVYTIPGLAHTLQLDSYAACSLLTGSITNWDDAAIAAVNPGVVLPDLTVRPVTESDPAGTNFAVQSWCIAEQPALWASFANHENSQPGGPTDGNVISPTDPNPDWPGLPGGLDVQSTTAVAEGVSTTTGAVGAVEAPYATNLGFGSPAQGMASVKNASGYFTQPTPLDVTSALAYATQAPDGSAHLNFSGQGPYVYNPSTYSYLLVRTAGSDPTRGAVMSGLVNYALTLGQARSTHFGYGTLGLPLERFGIDEVMAHVPGAVPLTADEQSAYDCGDLTATDVAAGLTIPSCGPGTGAPETPLALALPVLAMGTIGAVVWARWRRSPRSLPTRAIE